MPPEVSSRRRRMLNVNLWPKRKSTRRPVIAVVPTLLTLGNAGSGFASICYAANVASDPESKLHLYHAALAIFVAMVFDALDGPVARLSRRVSNFGAELDSLSDAISFGAAPAFLMLQASHVLHPRIMWVIALLYVLAAVLRLARFNSAKDGDEQHLSFRGLPSPAAAGTVAAMVIFAPGVTEFAGLPGPDVPQGVGEWLDWLTTHCLPWVTLSVGCLMVSRFRYPHIISGVLQGRSNFSQIASLVFAGLALFAVHELAIPLIFLWYAGAPPIQSIIRWVSSPRRLTPPAESPPAPTESAG